MPWTLPTPVVTLCAAGLARVDGKTDTMKELLMVGALGVFVWLLRSFVGRPVRRLPHDVRPPAPNPETDVSMADTPIIIDTGTG